MGEADLFDGLSQVGLGITFVKGGQFEAFILILEWLCNCEVLCSVKFLTESKSFAFLFPFAFVPLLGF